MKVFDNYARYYDLLYRDKDYGGEAAFVAGVLDRHSPRSRSILELGCGTGRHAVELAKLGWSVTGVDQSEEMLAGARQRVGALPRDLSCRLQFRLGDVRSVRMGHLYGAVVSLFHVMSYQTTDGDLENAVRTSADHLCEGGLFLFDFWYGPAVLTDPPAVRVKRLSDDQIEVTRLAEPECDANTNVATVNYHVFIKDKSNGGYSEVRESHRMRYLFLPELRLLLQRHGLRLLESGGWCSNRPLGTDTWYGWAVAARTQKAEFHRDGGGRRSISRSRRATETF